MVFGNSWYLKIHVNFLNGLLNTSVLHYNKYFCYATTNTPASLATNFLIVHITKYVCYTSSKPLTFQYFSNSTGTYYTSTSSKTIIILGVFLH